MIIIIIIIIIINNYLRSVLQLCCDEMEENDSGILNLIISVLNCVDLYSIVDH